MGVASYMFMEVGDMVGFWERCRGVVVLGLSVECEAFFVRLYLR